MLFDLWHDMAMFLTTGEKVHRSIPCINSRVETLKASVRDTFEMASVEYDASSKRGVGVQVSMGSCGDRTLWQVVIVNYWGLSTALIKGSHGTMNTIPSSILI